MKRCAPWFVSVRFGTVRSLALLLPLLVPPATSPAAEEPAERAARPHPVENPQSPLMLAGPWVPKDTQTIHFAALPRVRSEHVVVSDVRATVYPRKSGEPQVGGVNQHNYLAHFAGKYWLMWSDSPGHEDRVGQRVSYATSPDALRWSKPRFLTPEPPGSGPESEHYGTRTDRGFRWIARGLWRRGEELYALAALDEAGGFFGPSVALHAFRLHAEEERWEPLGPILPNAVNNFPPKELADGNWLMSRRTHDYKTRGVEFVVGGRAALDSWESFPVLGSNSELAAEEPFWWTLPDGNLAALFRDNRRSGFLYRSFSTDQGRTWSRPARTNFPDATSKLFGLRLSDGRYALISNANPKKRDPLVLSLSDDGLVFHTMGWLVGGRHVDYPHAIEHEGSLIAAFAGKKQTVEVLKIDLADLRGLKNPPR